MMQMYNKEITAILILEEKVVDRAASIYQHEYKKGNNGP